MGRECSTAADQFIRMRIRELRIKHGLSQRQFGELIGISERQAYRCEHGINGVSASLLYVIAREMGVPLEYFFDELNPDQRQPSPGQRLLLDVMRNLGDVQNEKHLEAITQLTRALARH